MVQCFTWAVFQNAANGLQLANAAMIPNKQVAKTTTPVKYSSVLASCDLKIRKYRQRMASFGYGTDRIYTNSCTLTSLRFLWTVSWRKVSAWYPAPAIVILTSQISVTFSKVQLVTYEFQ